MNPQNNNKIIIRNQSESSQGPKLEQFEQSKNILLDYNPMFKINMHESIMINK